MANIEKHYGVKFKRNSGEIVLTLEGKGCSLLQLYGMQNNVKANEDYIVFNAENGYIVAYMEGKKNDFPNICEDMVGLHIDEVCNGLLEALNE